MSNDHQPRAGGPPPNRNRAGATRRAAVRDLLRLGERLTANSSGVRGDAERSLDRARRLYDDDDARTPIALSACRDALGAYRDAVDQSVRELCREDDQADAWPAAGQPDPRATGLPPRSARSRTRERIAGTLAVAGVAGVLGLVAWTGLPSWSGLATTAPDTTPAEVAAVAAPQPSAGPAGDSHAGVPSSQDEPRTTRMAQSGDVRRVVVSTLPAPEQTDDGQPDGSAPTDSTPPADASQAAPAPSSSAGTDHGSAGVTPDGAAASDDPADDPASQGAEAVGEATDRVDEVVDAVRQRVPDVGRRLGEALETTTQKLLPTGEAGADADGSQDGDDGSQDGDDADGGLLDGGLGGPDDDDAGAGG